MKLRSKINKQNIHKQGKVPKSLMVYILMDEIEN